MWLKLFFNYVGISSSLPRSGGVAFALASSWSGALSLDTSLNGHEQHELPASRFPKNEAVEPAHRTHSDPGGVLASVGSVLPTVIDSVEMENNSVNMLIK
jgi:hypothetical protein